MYHHANNIDDLLRWALKEISSQTVELQSTRGRTKEIFGVILQLTDPRARLSRTETKQGTLFSCLGELLWYLAGTDDLGFITHYLSRYEKDSEDGETIRGAYGPRLRRGEFDQLHRICQVLREKPNSRRAVVQLFQAIDSDPRHKEAPCTCSLQFVLRNGSLDLMVHMRSNDAFMGLPHDVFAFTMLQELIASDLEVELGTYKHCVGSLHLYEDHYQKAKDYLGEHWQLPRPMPRMPKGNPWPQVEQVLVAEASLRAGAALAVSTDALNPYWADIVRLLETYAAFRVNDKSRLSVLLQQMHSRIYDTYISKKLETDPKPRSAIPKTQLSFDLKGPED